MFFNCVSCTHYIIIAASQLWETDDVVPWDSMFLPVSWLEGKKDKVCAHRAETLPEMYLA